METIDQLGYDGCRVNNLESNEFSPYLKKYFSIFFHVVFGENQEL